MRRLAVLIVALVGLVGCEQTATPLPVALSPTDATLPTQTIPRFSYALSPEAASAFAKRDQLLAGFDVVIVDPQQDDGSTYDIVVALGTVEGMTPSPIPLTVKLSLKSTLQPLDDPQVADLVQQIFQPGVIAAELGLATGAAPAQTIEPATIRVQLANAGYPDGLNLNLISTLAPRSERLPDLLHPYGIDLHLTVMNDEDAERNYTSEVFNGAVTGSGSTWIEQPDSHLIDLYSIPVSYRAAGAISLSFTPQGFPIPANLNG